jgi:uncharacterized protein YjdB
MRKALISGILSLILVSSVFNVGVNALEQGASASNNVQVVQGASYNHNSSTKEKIMSKFKASKENKNYKKDEIIVKYKPALSTFSLQEVEKKHSVNTKKKMKNGISVAKFDSSKHSMEETLNNLNSDPDVEYAEPNYLIKLNASPASEPYFGYMWGLKNSSTPGIDINIETVWNTLMGNSSVVVGVIDSGIDYNHEDLKDSVWVNTAEIPNNGIDDDNDGYIDDYKGWDFYNNDNKPYDDNGHGTHVSGIIAASNNGKGVVGIAPKVKIMPMNVGNSDGYLYDSDVIEAINYGVSKGVKIFNCSFGGEGYSAAQYDTMKNSNALFIAAAGNEGLNNDVSEMYPANYNLPNIISVASIDKYGNMSSFSNYGALNVDIAAPGTEILSTVPNNGYAYMSGTSMATPFVTGVAALMLSENSNLSALQIKDYILKNVYKLPTLNGKVAAAGLLNAQLALEAAGSIDNTSVTVTKPQINIDYQGHVQNIGWQSWVKDGELSGTEGQGLRVEGFKIKLENAPAGLKVKYKTHVQNIGWQDFVYDGVLAGTQGQSLRVEALQIMLEGTDSDKYSVIYQAHVQNEGWQPWVKDGETAGTYGKSERIEALRIRIVEKVPTVKYQGHVQNIGWQPLVKDGELSGTEGQGLRVEGFKIMLQNAPSTLNVKYKAHVQNIGWQNWVYSGALGGTEGQGLRVEALQIMLEGTDASKYSIEYQAHVQNIGWQPWVKDGEIAGTYGKGFRIEAIRLRIVYLK